MMEREWEKILVRPTTWSGICVIINLIFYLSDYNILFNLIHIRIVHFFSLFKRIRFIYVSIYTPGIMPAT